MGLTLRPDRSQFPQLIIPNQIRSSLGRATRGLIGARRRPRPVAPFFAIPLSPAGLCLEGAEGCQALPPGPVQMPQCNQLEPGRAGL